MDIHFPFLEPCKKKSLPASNKPEKKTKMCRLGGEAVQ
jgi:hypothetical protein